MSHRTDLDPNDWHASKHACPDGLLKERAWDLAARSIGDAGRLGPADVVARAKAFHAWLAEPYAIKGSSAPFWRAVRALDQAIEEARLPMKDRSTKGILAAADRWLAAFADWEAFA